MSTSTVLPQQEVAEQMRAEEALRASEEKYRLLVETSTDVIWAIDAARQFTYISPAIMQLRGLTPEEAMHEQIEDAVCPEFLPRLAESRQKGAAFRAAGGIGFTDRMEIQQSRRDGSRVWVEVVTRELHNDRGERTGTLGISRDITARKRAEAIIRLRLRLFEFAADHSLEELMQEALDEIGAITDSPIGFYHFVEADQKILSLQAWSTRTRQEFCTAEGKGLHYNLDQAGVWVDCVHQRKPVIHNDYASLPHRKGLPDGHAQVTRELVVPTIREGCIVSILGIGNKPSNYDDKDVELVAYVADVVWTIVERKRAEETLQRYQRQLEAQNLELRKLSLAIEQSGSTIVITDAEGAIQYANPSFEETTGYSVSEALSQNPRILKSGEQSPDYYRALWETIGAGKIWRGEFHNRRKDGTLYWESATIAPVHDAAGQITNYIAVKEDITDAKLAQETLRQYAEQLAAQNAELDAFAHTVAHDLKNPVGLVIGYADLLLDSCSSLSPAELQEMVEQIQRAGHKLDTIIESLLLLAGVRKQAVTPQPVAMGEIVQEACDHLRPVIQDTRACIILPEPAAWPLALGHAPWLERVWANYLSNALKYGGQPPQVELGWDGPAADEELPAGQSPMGQAHIRFWVRDNGPGLTPEAQKELFKPFTRLAQPSVEGHGLGLSIVRRILEKLGGQVGVDSAPGQGSLFYFTLPPAPGAAPLQEEENRDQAACG